MPEIVAGFTRCSFIGLEYMFGGFLLLWGITLLGHAWFLYSKRMKASPLISWLMGVGVIAVLCLVPWAFLPTTTDIQKIICVVLGLGLLGYWSTYVKKQQKKGLKTIQTVLAVIIGAPLLIYGGYSLLTALQYGISSC